MSTDQRYDLVLYGATGFTGSQGARVLAAHRDRPHFRYAIAGRNREKLEALRDAIALEVESDGAPEHYAGPDGVLVADAKDADAIDAMVANARAVATTAGPFWEYGNELVRSCVEQGVDYVDITGETPWIRGVIDRFHDHAEEQGTRIVPCCGYDSVPSDLGTWFAADQLQQRTGETCVEVRAFHRGKGGINGGTVASLLNLQKLGKTSELDDPYLLNPEGLKPAADSGEARRDRDPAVPYYESRLRAWAAPFFMGPINTRVVRRSQALLQEFGEGYGPGFRYQEYWKSGGPLGLLESGSLATIQATTMLFARSPFHGWPGRAPSPGSWQRPFRRDHGQRLLHHRPPGHRKRRLGAHRAPFGARGSGKPNHPQVSHRVRPGLAARSRASTQSTSRRCVDARNGFRRGLGRAPRGRRNRVPGRHLRKLPRHSADS